MKQDPDPRARRWYGTILAALAVAVGLSALVSLRKALEADIGPLEGVAVTADGGIAPEPPIRVAILDEQRAVPMRLVAPVPEMERWMRLTALPGITAHVVGPEDLPRTPDQADVVIIPWGRQPSPRRLETLTDYLQHGGGVILAAPPDPTSPHPPRAWKQPPETEPGGDASPAPRTAGDRLDTPRLPGTAERTRRQEEPYRAFLRRVFGVTTRERQGRDQAQAAAQGSRPPPVHARPAASSNGSGPAAPARIVAVPGDLLEFLLPAGYPLTIPAHIIGRANTTCRRPVADVAYRTRAGRDERSCILSATESLPGRALWLGFPLTPMGGARDSTRVLQHALMGLIRWTAGRPLLLVEPWPAGLGRRVGIAMVMEEGPGAECLNDMMRRRGLRGTWFIRDDAEQPSGHPPLTAPGDVGLLAPDNLLEAAPADRRRFLIERVVNLRRGATRSPLGVLIRSDDPLRGVIQDLAIAGFDYVLAHQDTKRHLPRWISTHRARLIRLPAPVIDFARPPGDPRQIGLGALERLKQAWPEDVGRPLSIVELGSRGACEPHIRHQLETVLDELADSRRYLVAPLGELVAQWRHADNIRTECRALDNDRLFIRVARADASQFDVAMDLFMANASALDGVVSHRLRAPAWRADCRRLFRCRLTTRIPAGLRRMDFFVKRRSSK